MSEEPNNKNTDAPDVISFDGDKYKWKRNVEEHLKELLAKGFFLNKKLALIGSWRDHEWLYETFGRYGLKLSYIADNNPNKQGVIKLGIETCSVVSLKEIENLAILVSGLYASEISQQLKNLGYQEDIDYVLLAYEKNSQERDIEKQNKFDTGIRKGFDICMGMKEKYGEKPIWLMHQISLGDLYLFSLLLPGVMGKASVSECDVVLVVARKTTAHFAEVLGYKQVELVPLEDMYFSLLPLVRLMGDELNLHNAVYHGTDEVFVRMINYTSIDFLDSFKKGVFYLDDDVELTYPSFPHRDEVVGKLFEENKLVPGKTILISPYATHFMPSITDGQWETLVDLLVQKGYTVCTNCAPGETPIKGTKGVFVLLEDCEYFVEKAGGFIGVRSGLCDVICQADSKKVVIYDANGNATLEFHGFSTMGIGKRITEIVNDTIHTDEMIKEIGRMF